MLKTQILGSHGFADTTNTDQNHTRWLLISDLSHPLACPGAELDRGTLIAELARPLPSDVLLAWHDGQGRAFSLFQHYQSGISLMWRDGARLIRHHVPGDLSGEGGAARLLFHWDRAANLWAIRVEDAAGRPLGQARGAAPALLPFAVWQAICAGQGQTRRDSTLQWFGLCDGPPPPPGLPWIGPATPVTTPSGEVPAGSLRPGDWVMTRDAGPLRLRGLRQVILPARGRHAGVELRAPYFGQRLDLAVSADQPVVLSGRGPEYLFGEDAVLVAAGALLDGVTARPGPDRALCHGLSLDLGGLHLIEAGGCLLQSGHHGAADHAPLPPLRRIADYEARPMVELLRRMQPLDGA